MWLVGFLKCQLLVLVVLALVNAEERPGGQITFPGNRETLRCYVGTNTGLQGTTICPSWTTGCVKRTICKNCLYLSIHLELPYCKKCKKSPCQDTGLGNRGPLKALNDTKLILND